MQNKHRVPLIVGAVIGLSAAIGCGGPTATVVPAPVVPPPLSADEAAFIDLAREQGGFNDYYDDEVLELGYQVCNDLTDDPEAVFYNYDIDLITLAVSSLCPEHEETVYYYAP